MNKKLIRKMLTAAGGPLFPWLLNTELIDNWKFKTTPASRSRVLSGKGVETDKQYTERRKKETTKRTWRSDAADVAHGIGEGVLALNPYTAIPYFGAKVGLDFLNGNVGWHTALNASVPLFHMAPQAVGLREATNVALEDAANAGSKTARNWRVAREIKQATKNKPNLSNRTVSTDRTVNRITGLPDVLYTLYNEFGEPIGQTNVGGATLGNVNRASKTSNRMIDGVYSKNKAHKVSEDTYNVAIEDILNNGGIGLESGWSLMSPLKTMAVTSKFPYTVIGQEFGNPVRLLTGNTKRAIPQRVLGNHYLEIKPKTEIKFNEVTGEFEEIPIKEFVLEPSTSLKFFERKPSKISEAERAGVSKGDRNLPFKSKLLTEHIQGDEAVKMFKEYGGEPIPEGSINGELLRKYVAEARERYGLTNNKNITDEEIAQALYKHSKELGGNTAAVNTQGEPQLLFRGDTRRYTQLKERMSPEELATKSGTMDNSLGNLFLGELPGTAGKHTRGLERYLVTGNEFLEKRLEGSGTGSRAVMPDGTFANEWGSTISEFPEGSYHLVTYNTKHGPNTYYKLPSSYSESGVNDINAFVVRTPQVRDASREISVLNDDFMVKGGPKVEYHGPIRKEVSDKDGFPLIVDEKGNVVANGLAGSSDRQAMALHYRYVLNDAKNKKQGLLKSNGETDGTPGNYLRDEHDDYTYFALPNFNLQGAKHLLPYDLRIPRNWKDKNIYRGLIPLTTGYTLYNIFNQPLQQLQYLKQGGKMNILEFLKNGSGIHIKEKNKGKFTSYCGGKVTDECILKGKNSSNPAIRKRATFAANARKWKHKEGGMLNLLQKFLGGGKTSFWSKAGDFMLNSGLALNLLGAGMNAIFGNPQKKSFNESAKIAKSEVDMLTEKLKQLAMLQADQDVLNLLLLDPANPNAFGGPIVLKVLREGFYKKYLKDIKENANQQKALIDAQSQLMSDGNTSDFLTSILGTGLNAAIGYFGNKVSNNTSTTNNSGGGWTMNYNSLYGNKSNYNNFFLTGSLPKMNSVVSPNTSWLNNNPLST